jgi:hypothetical protein
METATWVIAVTSMMNVVVLGVYACFTHGIWRETQKTALRTEDLARKSWETLKVQIVLSLVHERELRSDLLARTWASGGDPARHIEYLTQPLLTAFPEQSRQAEIRELIKLVFGVEPK